MQPSESVCLPNYPDGYQDSGRVVVRVISQFEPLAHQPARLGARQPNWEHARHLRAASPYPYARGCAVQLNAEPELLVGAIGGLILGQA